MNRQGGGINNYDDGPTTAPSPKNKCLTHRTNQRQLQQVEELSIASESLKRYQQRLQQHQQQVRSDDDDEKIDRRRTKRTRSNNQIVESNLKKDEEESPESTKTLKRKGSGSAVGSDLNKAKTKVLKKLITKKAILKKGRIVGETAKSDDDQEAVQKQHPSKHDDDDEHEHEQDGDMVAKKHELQEEQQPQQAPQRKPTWKKPADMPKRPLSAYNLFFRKQRQELLGAADSTIVLNNPLYEQAKRKHRKTHGKMSFEHMAKNIAYKWQNLDVPAKSIYEKEAAIEKNIYNLAMEEYKQKQKNIASNTNTSNTSNTDDNVSKSSKQTLETESSVTTTNVKDSKQTVTKIKRSNVKVIDNQQQQQSDMMMSPSQWREHNSSSNSTQQEFQQQLQQQLAASGLVLLDDSSSSAAVSTRFAASASLDPSLSMNSSSYNQMMKRSSINNASSLSSFQQQQQPNTSNIQQEIYNANLMNQQRMNDAIVGGSSNRNNDVIENNLSTRSTTSRINNLDLGNDYGNNTVDEMKSNLTDYRRSTNDSKFRSMLHKDLALSNMSSHYRGSIVPTSTERSLINNNPTSAMDFSMNNNSSVRSNDSSSLLLNRQLQHQQYQSDEEYLKYLEEKHVNLLYQALQVRDEIDRQKVKMRVNQINDMNASLLGTLDSTNPLLGTNQRLLSQQALQRQSMELQQSSFDRHHNNIDDVFELRRHLRNNNIDNRHQTTSIEQLQLQQQQREHQIRLENALKSSSAGRGNEQQTATPNYNSIDNLLLQGATSSELLMYLNRNNNTTSYARNTNTGTNNNNRI